VRLDNGFLITPTSSSFGRLEPERLSLLDPEGRHRDGDKPSKEWAVHRAMYRARSLAGAVVHLHAPNCMAVACLGHLDPESVLPPLTPYKPFKERTAMFVVTVEFRIKKQHEREFRETVLNQARNSLTHEADCHRFDVSTDAKDGGRVFLYELYTDEAAYQAHRQTPHYHDFSTRVANWVAQKNVQTWDSLYPA